jgi:hypothetical protein
LRACAACRGIALNKRSRGSTLTAAFSTDDDGCVDDLGCVVGLDDLGTDDLGRIAGLDNLGTDDLGRIAGLDNLGCIDERNCTDIISDLAGIDNLDDGCVDVGCYHDVSDLDCIIDDIRYIAPSRGDRSLYGRFVSRPSGTIPESISRSLDPIPARATASGTAI